MPLLRLFSRRESRILWHLAWPGVIAQLGMMLTGVVDTLMLGRVSVEALAAVALGHAWLGATLFAGTGLMMGMDPFISQAHGARDQKALGVALQRGLLLSLLATVPISWGLTQTESALLALGQEPSICHAAQEYTAVQMSSVPFFMVGTAIRQYFQGRGLVRPIMWVMVLVNIFNLLANWVLIFGHLGFDAMHLLGAGHATNISRFLYGTFMVLVLWPGKLHVGGWLGWSREALNLKGLWTMFRVGLPLYVSFSLELWAFMGTSMIAGLIDIESLAAHQVVLNMAAIAFMIPMGFSMGASTRIGNLAGGKRLHGVKRSAATAFCVGMMIMSVLSFTFILGRNVLPLLYTSEAAVVSLCTLTLPIVGAFQFVDGAQVICAGILRGLGFTTIAAISSFLAYLVVGIPLGAYLALSTSWGFPGLWMGLFAGLAVAALVLSTNVRLVLSRLN